MLDIATFWRQGSPAVRVAVRLGIALSFALWPWPAFGRVYSEWVACFANAFFSSALPMLNLRPEGPSDSWNAILTVTGSDGSYQELAWDMRRVPYLPSAVFIALVVAIPFGRASRRLLVFGTGLVALQILPALRLLLLLGSETPVRLLEMPSALHSVLFVACSVLVFPSSMAYVVPATLWLFAMWLADREALRRGLRETFGSRRTLALEPSVPARTTPARDFGVVLHRPKKRSRRRGTNSRRSKKR